MATQYASGLGRTYRKVPAYEVSTGRRTERTTTLTAGDYTVDIIVRDTVIIEDPYLNLVRAAAFQIAQKGPFPVPPVGRDIKDFLIKTNLEA